MEKYRAFYIILQNQTKPCMLAVKTVPTQRTTSLQHSQVYFAPLVMNLHNKMKKKLKKNKKNIKKKVVTTAKIFAAGALLTAGRNMVDKISEDNTPEISASEVTWNQDQGASLFKIETLQRDSGTSSLVIGGYIMLALGMILLALPALRAIKWVIKSCGGHTRTHSLDEEESEDKKERKTEGKYKTVVYTPSPPTPAENQERDDDSIPSTSMARFQDKLENEISILTKKLRNEN